jgi:4-hydroxybenzoate polyprenyltransferase
MVEKKQNSKSSFLKNKFISYVNSFRLSCWFIVSVFFLLGEWYSIQKFLVVQSVIVLLALLGIFSSGSLINIVFDKKLDIFARKPIVKVFQYISTKEMLVMSVFLSFIPLLLLYFFINIEVFLLGFLIVIIGIFYSTSPIRLKTKPPFDCLMNALGGSIPFFMGWMITLNSLTSESIFYFLILFLIISHIFFFYTTTDIEMDKELGIRTSCNIIGLKNSLILGSIIYILDLFMAIYFFGITDLLVISLLTYIPLIILAFVYRNNRKQLVNVVGGLSTLIFAGAILILLSFFSKNIFPIFFLMIWIFFIIYDIIIFKKYVKR